jgi:hypothetical protein
MALFAPPANLLANDRQAGHPGTPPIRVDGRSVRGAPRTKPGLLMESR